MIVAREQPQGQIVSLITNKSGPVQTAIRVGTTTAATMPTRLNIKTNEAQLRGPPGGADQVELQTNPLAYFILALE